MNRDGDQIADAIRARGDRPIVPNHVTDALGADYRARVTQRTNAHAYLLDDLSNCSEMLEREILKPEAK